MRAPQVASCQHFHYALLAESVHTLRAGVCVQPDPSLAWFFSSIGVLFRLVLFGIIVDRMIFHPPVPARLLSTLVILIAPAGLGVISSLKRLGGVAACARAVVQRAVPGAAAVR